MILGGLVIAVSVIILIVIINSPTEIYASAFFEKLFDGEIHTTEKDPLAMSGDTWSYTSNNKSYYVYLYNTANADQNKLEKYNVMVSQAKLLVSSYSSIEDEAARLAAKQVAEAEWEEIVRGLTENYNITTDTSLESFAGFSPIVFKQANRYSVSWTEFIYPSFLLISLVLLFFYMFKMMKNTTNTSGDFGKNKATVQSKLKVRFTDVAGAEEEKAELAEIVEFLKTPDKFVSVGARVPKGVLLVGPPGTGKTLFAKAVAGEANVPFFSISGSDFVEMFVGVGASRVRDLFAQAKKAQPCIIFIDEIDAVGRQRGAGLGGGNDEREQTLNQLLVQMDGFDSNESIIIMAATNRVDILDPALMRPGRFDRQIYVHIPDVRGREAIFKVHARNKPISGEIDFQRLARLTTGFTGAEIENLLNEAAILCARAGRSEIIMDDIYEAIDKVVMGPQKKSRLVTEVDKRITAYHESGHAIVAHKLQPHCDPVQEISIIPRGMAAGYTMTRPDTDDEHLTLKRLTARIAMTMGGRAAEEIVIQDISAGAAGDIQQATNIARRMVTEWGMSDNVGPIYYGGSQEVFLGRDYGTSHSYSEDTAATIDNEIHQIVETGHQTALSILRENRQVLDTVVRVLIERETIYQEEFELIMNGASAEDVIKTIDERRGKGLKWDSSESK